MGNVAVRPLLLGLPDHHLSAHECQARAYFPLRDSRQQGSHGVWEGVVCQPMAEYTCEHRLAEHVRSLCSNRGPFTSANDEGIGLEHYLRAELVWGGHWAAVDPWRVHRHRLAARFRVCLVRLGHLHGLVGSGARRLGGHLLRLLLCLRCRWQLHGPPARAQRLEEHVFARGFAGAPGQGGEAFRAHLWTRLAAHLAGHGAEFVLGVAREPEASRAPCPSCGHQLGGGCAPHASREKTKADPPHTVPTPRGGEARLLLPVSEVD
mmetsp:Transcript_24774/g.62064  ORF Transcript_24774/g.62064 Transcript_24774/m.62064 type:complete len:264 (-) Transcript_24774:256-1047(-)